MLARVVVKLPTPARHIVIIRTKAVVTATMAAFATPRPPMGAAAEDALTAAALAVHHMPVPVMVPLYEPEEEEVPLVPPDVEA